MARHGRERDILRDTYDEDDPYQISYTLGRNNEEAIKRQEEDIKQINKALHKKSAETNSMGSPLKCNTGFLYRQKRVIL